jgi:hypothetical protein
MTPKQMRDGLFGAFFLIFLCTAAITLLGITSIRPIPEGYLKPLFTSLILEVVGAMVILFRVYFLDKPSAEMPDIEGDWKYRCTRDGDEHQHGGTCNIHVEQTAFGIEFVIIGQRLWTAKKVNGMWQRLVLESPQDWRNSWGAITDKDTMRYDYSIENKGGNVHGYSWATIKDNLQGKPVSFVGKFYQLPPFDPFFGRQEFQRMSDSSDTEWALTKPVT